MMKKRIFALILCVSMILSMSFLQAFAADDDAVDSFIDSGELSFGSVRLCGGEAGEVTVDFAYSQRLSISGGIYGTLSDYFGDAGLSVPELDRTVLQFSNQSFLMLHVSDTDALSDMAERIYPSDSDVPKKSAVSGTDVSESDASSSDAVSDADADKKKGKKDKDKKDKDKEEESLDFVIEEEEKELTVLQQLCTGLAIAPAGLSLQKSLQAAFPEFTFDNPEGAKLPSALDDDDFITLSKDGCTATIDIIPEPEYIEKEVYGETFTVILMSDEAYRYTLKKYTVKGNLNENIWIKPQADESDREEENVSSSDTTTTAPTTETTNITTETTTTTTTTTTATITATTTATTEKTTSATETKPTKTTKDEEKTAGRAYVSTRSKRLRIRTGPGFEYDIITLMPKGTRVTVLSTDNPKWYHIRMEDGTEGYSWSGYLTLY